MPTKRPDQLPDIPEDDDINFEDILMVEKSPDTNLRKLYKAKLRELMADGLRMDTERMGENAILGMQSKFDWLIAQMEKLADNPVVNVDAYNEFSSPSKDKEIPYITPTPTPTPSVTPSPIPPTPSPLPPGQPKPSPTPTPTPTPTPKAAQITLQVTLTGNNPQIVNLPQSYLPQAYGYSNWALKNGTTIDNIYSGFAGFRPDSFTPSGSSEQLSTLKKVSDTQLSIETVLLGPDDEFLGTEGQVESSQGLLDGCSLTFSIILF